MSPAKLSQSVATPLAANLTLTFLMSLGTGMLWNAIPFITKVEYKFTQAQNLLLYIVIGLVYVGTALSAGNLVRRVRRWLSARAVLAVVIVMQALICMLPLVFRGPWVAWVVSIIFSATSAVLWPIVESYMSAGRHGAQMRFAIGIWNIAWTAAVAVPLWGMAPLMETSPRLAIVGLGACLLLALAPLVWFAPAPVAHDADQTSRHITDEYPLLLRSARVMLPLSYVLVSAMAPLLPYLLDRLAVAMTWQTPAAATWMMARVVAIALMWRLAFWHGRWGAILLGALAMVLGFALVVTAPALFVLLAGLSILGAGLGIVYYAALYYAMSVGSAAVDAGGKHEALIGAGYAVGPVAALGSLAATEPVQQIGVDVQFEQVLVGVVWALVGLGALSALQPYRRARQRRHSRRATRQ